MLKKLMTEMANVLCNHLKIYRFFLHCFTCQSKKIVHTNMLSVQGNLLNCFLILFSSFETDYFWDRFRKLWETGLTNYWMSKFIPRVDQCLVNSKLVDSKKKISRPIRIELTHLTSAFFILGFGYVAALIVFCLENLAK